MRRKNTLGIVTVFLFLLLFFVSGTFVSAKTVTTPFEPNEVVIKLNQSEDLRAIAQIYGLDPTPICQMGTNPLYRMRIISGVSVSRTISQLQSDPQQRVAFAEPNYLIGAPSQSDVPWSMGGGTWSIGGGTWSIGGGTWSIGGSVRAYSNQWMLEKINLAASHKIARGQGIKIAVLDTGIDYTHPIFEGKLLPGYDFVDYDYYASEVGVWGQGAFGHGTAVAGIAITVAPDARIIPIRVLDQNGVGNVWRLAEGLRFAANPDGSIYTSDGADVINLSLGTTETTSLIRETLDLVAHDTSGVPMQKRIVVVAAAGNTGDATRIYPAAEQADNLIAVAASTDYDTLTDFSTRGDWISIMAPGERIVSAVPNGGYVGWRGTSMSAPIVSGITALVMNRYPAMNSNHVARHVKGTSEDTGGAVFLRVNAARSLILPPVPTN